jgi:hypothetical protein
LLPGIAKTAHATSLLSDELFSITEPGELLPAGDLSPRSFLGSSVSFVYHLKDMTNFKKAYPTGICYAAGIR